MLRKVLDRYPDMRLPAIYDAPFKLLFTEVNYLSKLLTFFLPYSLNVIKNELLIKNSEIINANVTSRGSIGDLIVIVKDYTILIECNIKKNKLQYDKNIHTLYGLGFTQYDRGQLIDGKKKLMLLSFDNYDILGKRQTRYDGMLMDKISHISLYKNLEIIHVNLALVRNILYNTYDITKLDEFTKYLTMIVNPSKKIGYILGRDIYMAKANKRLNNYVKDFKYVSEVINDAYKRGERKRGEAIGKAKEKESMARKMIKNNLDNETIVKYTELPINKIQKLRQNII